MKKLSIDRAIKALESGKYHKGRNKLETESGYNCCLGVFAKEMGVEFYGPKKNRQIPLNPTRYHDDIPMLGEGTSLNHYYFDKAPWIIQVKNEDIPLEYRDSGALPSTTDGQNILMSLNDNTRQGYDPIIETLKNTRKRLRQEKSKK